MTFYFAWVAPGTAFDAYAHSVQDEDVFAFEITHSEGDFPMLGIDIRNPRTNLLGPYRLLWAWLSQDGVPLFFGRLVAMPEQIVQEIVHLNFIARPSNYDTVKLALAETLKVAPYWDYIWIKSQKREDPDVVLEARPQLWHIDRITHAVTVSDINVGEDGTTNFGTDEAFYAPLNITYGAAPLRRVQVKATVSWDQVANGTLDFTKVILDGFDAAGSPSKKVSSYTGQGLQIDWPKLNQSFNGGWHVGQTVLRRLDGKSRPSRFKIVKVDRATPPTTTDPAAVASSIVAPPLLVQFFVWEFQPTFPLTYDVKRKRIETLEFTLEADVQSLVVEPGEDEAELITLSTKVGEVIDLNDIYETPPIGDLRRNSYFTIDRGVQSVEYLIMLARAHLLARARTVNVQVTVPFSVGIDLTCRKNGSVTDPRLPAGVAFGKVIDYKLIARGTGEQLCVVTLGCTIGTGEVVAPSTGTPVYVDVGYVDLGYQIYAGGQLVLLSDQITYDEYRDTPILDDGINFLDLRQADVTNSFVVLNGEDEQEDVLSVRYTDIPAAIEGLNAKFTECILDLKPLVGGPFQTDFVLTTSRLMIPQTIEL